MNDKEEENPWEEESKFQQLLIFREKENNNEFIPFTTEEVGEESEKETILGPTEKDTALRKRNAERERGRLGEEDFSESISVSTNDYSSKIGHIGGPTWKRLYS